MRINALCCGLLACCLLLLNACAGRFDDEISGTRLNFAGDQKRTAGQSTSTSLPQPQKLAIPPLPGEVSPSDAPDELDSYSSSILFSIADPFEPWNRFWFSFNDVCYVYLLRPIYTAYAFVTPDQLRAGLKNALNNALFPVRFVNSILQGRLKAAGVEFGRFLVNTTLGAGGLMDVVKDKKAIVETDPYGTDFGQTLGIWGLGPGIYLVWPLIGPSNLRDTAGRAADWAMDPLLFVPGTTTLNMVTAGIWGGLRFNAMDATLTTYEDITKSAIDPYLAIRDMYTRYRQSRIDKQRTEHSGIWRE